MTAPGEALLRFAWGLALGAALGFCYDFLRPLRRRHHAPADVLFVITALVLWVRYSFQICQGDIRVGGTASMGLGAVLWQYTAAPLSRRLCTGFWKAIFWIFSDTLTSSGWIT